MKIFISHSQDDEDLARVLKDILEKESSIDEAFIFEDKKKIGVQIDKKITNELDDSNYLVAIITENSRKSASVHQELGYAQAKNLEKIPMCKKDTEKGFLLYSTENVEFDENNFENKCLEVRQYIADNPKRRTFSEKEEHFIQRSSQYRYAIEYELSHFINSVIVYFDVNHDDRLFYDEKGRQMVYGYLEKFMSDTEIIEKLEKLELRTFFKVFNDYEFLRECLEEAKRFPHSELYPEEQDALLRLTERIAENSDSYINVEKLLKLTMSTELLDYDTTYKKLISKYPNLVTLKDHMKSYWFYLKEIILAVMKLDKEYLNLRKKFGDLAVKDTYGKNWA